MAIIPDDFNGKVDHRIRFEYNHDSKKIILGINGKPADTCLSIDCDDFIKDGMLSSVYTTEEQPGYPKLVFVWNTDSGHQTTTIDIRSILGHIYSNGEYLTFNEITYEFDVDLPKLTNKLNINKMLKYVGHIENPATISSNYLSGIFSGIIETDSVLNGTFVDVVFSDSTIKATTLDNALTVGKGDIIIVHTHDNQVEVDKKDLRFGQNVFIIKAGVSRYEFEALKPSLRLDDISLSGAEAISVITGIGETGGIVHISAETLIPTMISGLREELNSLSYTDETLSNDISTKIYFNEYGAEKFGDLSVIKLGAEEYAELLDLSATNSQAIYIVSSDNKNAYGRKIINLADGSSLSDAVNFKQLTNKVQIHDYDNSVRYTDLSIIKMQKDAYDAARSGGLNQDALYMVSSDYIDAYGG